MQYALKEMGKKISLSSFFGPSVPQISEGRWQVPSLSPWLVSHIASIEIKDIWFLLPYLKEKFTDKEVSTLMIKPYLDLNTWAEPFSLQARIRGSVTPVPIC